MIFFTVILLAAGGQCFAQTDSAAIATADSSRFSVNEPGGWQLFNSYAQKYNTDSVQLELIIQHSNNIDWAQEQFIGTIKYTPLLPGIGQSIPFSLLNDGYIIRIDTAGDCFLKLITSVLPDKDIVVVPLKVFYKW